jgi:hypothetical protein
VKIARVETFFLSAIMIAFAACGYLPFMAASPPPRVKQSATPTPTATATSTPEVKKHKRRKHARGTPTATAGSPTPMSEATPGVVGTVITTGEPAAERSEIEGTIAHVESRLSAIKRERLSGQDAADYDRIKSFVADARAALAEQDDLRARSLAEKATRLVAQLAGRVSNQ